MPELTAYSSWTLSAAIAAALTLVTWVFFYFETPDAHLDTKDTTVVFGAWFLGVLLVRFFWRRVAFKKS
jgi:hypothetical protein